MKILKSGLAVPLARPASLPAATFTGTQTAGSVLTCAPGVWTGGGDVTFAYAWENDSVGALGAGNGGQTNAYTLQAGDATHRVRCKVTATDSVWGATVGYTPWSDVIAA